MSQNGSADVFLHVQPRHFDTAARCVDSVRAHLRGGDGRVVVVAAALPAGLRRTLDGLSCDYLHEADVFGFDATALPGDATARERLFTELLKWELRRFSRTPTYLVINPATTLHQPVDLWPGGRAALFCCNRFRFAHAMCFNYLFGQIPCPTSPAAGDLLHVDRDTVDEMVLKIQGRWRMPWARAAVSILDRVAGTAFDAAHVYGHYLNLFRPGAFAVTPHESPPPAPVANGPGVVRMSTLGHNGRFGNQLFQYAYLMSYAERENLRPECPPWVGSALFGHRTSLGDDALPVYREDRGDADPMIRFDPRAGLTNIELWGYFHDSHPWADDRDAFRRLFQPKPFLKQPLDAALARLRGDGRTLVAIHVRRGDYTGGPIYWPAPEAWYLRWLDRLWPTLADPVLYVATDDPANVLPHFAAYRPRSAADLNVSIDGAGFYADFYVLSQADVVGISNSTFSFAAAMMNTAATAFARPEPTAGRMVPFDPWASPVVLTMQRVPAVAA